MPKMPYKAEMLGDLAIKARNSAKLDRGLQSLFLMIHGLQSMTQKDPEIDPFETLGQQAQSVGYVDRLIRKVDFI